MEPKRSFRFDVQVLRGIAVLAVVLFHGFPTFAPAGYLGVDVFFVISGYLITLAILIELESGRFSFRTFYLRRARRLLPAAFATFLGTTVLGYLFMTSVDWSAYLRQLIGAVTFTANIVLWRQGGYFEASAETKPLLHIWSLSVEEQFYFVIPLVLVLTAARLRGPMLIAATIASLALCFSLAGNPDLTNLVFYMLPTRAWELLVGSSCAWLTARRVAIAGRWLAPLAFAALIAVLVAGDWLTHPYAGAVIAVLATAAIIASLDGWLAQTPLTRSLRRIGNWSYSLYLVHWPIYCFAYLAYVGRPPLEAMMVATAIAFSLGWLQYRFVENRWRFASDGGRRPALALGVAAGALVALALPASARERAPVVRDRARALDGITGLAAACDTIDEERAARDDCRTTTRPRIAVWGDSNAMQLLPGLMDDRRVAGSLEQLTMSSCAPTPGVAAIPPDLGLEWAMRCDAFNRKALARILASPSIHTVVISSTFYQILTDVGMPLLVAGRPSEWTEIGSARLRETLNILHEAGKRSLLVAPIPRATFDPAACNLRRLEGVITLTSECDIRKADVADTYTDVATRLRALAAATGAQLVLPETALCSARTCRTMIDGQFTYRDQGHLSKWGSHYVIRSLGINDVLMSLSGSSPRPLNKKDIDLP